MKSYHKFRLTQLVNQSQLYLHGDPSLNDSDNKIIILSTIKYIKETRRYNRVKNELRSLTRRLRKEFEIHLTKNIKGSPDIKSKMKTTSKIPPLKKKINTVATTPKEKAETLNTFFGGNFTDELIEHIPNDYEIFVGDLLNSKAKPG